MKINLEFSTENLVDVNHLAQMAELFRGTAEVSDLKVSDFGTKPTDATIQKEVYKKAEAPVKVQSKALPKKAVVAEVVEKIPKVESPKVETPKVTPKEETTGEPTHTLKEVRTLAMALYQDYPMPARTRIKDEIAKLGFDSLTSMKGAAIDEFFTFVTNLRESLENE